MGKIKRGLTSFTFWLGKKYNKISHFSPSLTVLTLIGVGLTVFLLGGGLYDLIVRPYSAVYSSGRFIFLYPQLSEQFITDSIVAMTLYVFGFTGFVLVYQSTKYAYKPRQAYLMFIVGVTLMIIAYIGFETVIHLKISG